MKYIVPDLIIYKMLFLWILWLKESRGYLCRRLDFNQNESQRILLQKSMQVAMLIFMRFVCGVEKFVIYMRLMLRGIRCLKY